jgi:uncharacterized protein (DUF885 family)
MTDDALDALARECFDWYAAFNPIFATFRGVHTYDHLLPKGTYDAVQEETFAARAFLDRLEQIDRKTLSPGRRIDFGVMRNSLRLRIFENDELRIWEAKPEGAEGVGDSLFPLFMREFAPFPRRMESLIGRLERAPRYLEETKSRLRAPTRIWTEIGLESTQQTPGFLQVIEAAGKAALPSADSARLREAVAKTNEALADQEKWIRVDVLPRAKESVGVGASKLRRLVALRELGLTVEELYAIGKRYLRESKRELAKLAPRIRRGATVARANELVKSDRPKDWKGAFEYTAKAMEEAKRFIVERRLATLPEKESLRVIETPTYLRHVIPFAAYSSPARFDAVQEGLYMVTPHEDKPEMLREAYHAGIRNTAVHEGYPGHHLQLSCANLNPSFARLFGDPVETIEGWAHYGEQMMKEQGFDADPATKFAQMTDQIWRACRIIIDIDLHSRRMTFDEAVDFLAKETGMERPGAVAEVKRYSFTPAYPLSYLTGKHLILQLRRDVRKGLGKQYSDKFFHDTYLYAGSIPLRYMRALFAYKVKELQKLQRKGL